MDYILTPDSLSAKQTRQALSLNASNQSVTLLDVRIGTFSGLISCLRDFWLIPEAQDDWKAELQQQAIQMENAFWAQSIKVDEMKVLRQIESSLLHLLKSLPLDQELSLIQLPETKVQRRYNDLVLLHQGMNGIFPENISIARQWIKQADVNSLDNLIIHFDQDLLYLEPWQTDVIERLQGLSKSQVSPYQELIKHTLLVNTKELSTNTEDQSSDYRNIANNLFESKNTVSIPESYSGLTCRDIKQETELVASMVQSIYSQDKSYDGIVIQYPENTDYPVWLYQAFERTGIPFSNLDYSQSIFDWQTALLRDLITLKSQKTPTMTLMSILINPLMPWSNDRAHSFAKLAQSGRLIKYIDDANNKSYEVPKLLLELIKPQASSSAQLLDFLTMVCNLVDAKEQYGLTKERLNDKLLTIEQWFKLYEMDSFSIQCLKVLNQLQAGVLNSGSTKSSYLNSVSCIATNEVNIKPTKHLFILGFNQGHYHFDTEKYTQNQVFTSKDWSDLANHAQLPLNTFTEQSQYEKNNFKRSLSLIKNSLTLIASQQDFEGKMLHLSDTALDFALCFYPHDKVNPEQLFIDVNSTGNDDKDDYIHPFIQMEAVEFEKRPQNEIEDIDFDIDLLALHKTKDGSQRPESPSSLETLLVSPLAWFLDRQGIRDMTWEVQSLNIMLQGTIAHKLFELYEPYQDKTIPDVSQLFDNLFKEAVEIEASFLFEPQWQFEFLQLSQKVKPAFEQFIVWLKELNWKVIDSEQKLTGNLWSNPIKGTADAILENDKGKILILDYKTSSSPARIKRLNTGYDLQTYIYRELYQQQNGKCDIHSGYFTLLDKTMVLDQFDEAQSVLDSPELDCLLTEQSMLANKAIKERFAQLKSGKIKLNFVTDTKYWKDLGITAYALDNNPIISRFLKPEVALANNI